VGWSQPAALEAAARRCSGNGAGEDQVDCGNAAACFCDIRALPTLHFRQDSRLFLIGLVSASPVDLYRRFCGFHTVAEIKEDE